MTATTVRRARPRPGQPAPAAAPIAPPAQPFWHGRSISLEGLLYATIFVAALVTRFWDLGRRALHHDESLHAQFSWMLAVGRGYTHDPLMHGPFLFHANALAYLLFGANDATSRVMPALAGCLLVLVPFLLRRQIGRWGALFASLLLLFSPSYLYYSRFIRHDVYTAMGTLLLFIAIVRYIEDRRPRWVYVGAAALALAITNHEITYVVIFIDVTFLAAIIIWRLSPRLAAVAGATLALMGLTFVALPRFFGWPDLPKIPWQEVHSGGGMGPIIGYLGAMLTHPRIALLLVEAILGLIAGLVVLRGLVRRAQPAPVPGRRARPPAAVGFFDSLFGRFEPGSTPYAVAHLLRDGRTLGLGALLFFTIFAVLFTTFFANLPGLLSGTFGAIGYWLGQHDVQRGDQPWFYYLILLPQYELIPVLFGGAMTLLTGARVVRFWRGRHPGSQRLLTEAFIAYWAVLMVAILSWAGEKMPWLITHAALPLIVLAASLLGELVQRLAAAGPRLSHGGLDWGVRHRGALTGAYAGLLLIIAFIFVQGAAVASLAQPPVPLPILPALLAAALATAGFGMLVGYRRAGLVAGLCLGGLLLLLQVRFGWIASFEHGDIPKEQLIYVQSSADVTRVMAEIERFSLETTGGKNIGIAYDGGEFGVAWPFEWYLRDFKNKRFFVDGPTADPGPEVPIVLLGSGNRGRAEQFLTEYEPVEYVLRWWYPEEETYRPFAIAPEIKPGRSAWRTADQPHGLRDILGSVVQSIAAQRDPAEQARLWRYFMYREPYAPLGSFNFILYVRKDVLRSYNAFRY